MQEYFSLWRLRLARSGSMNPDFAANWAHSMAGYILAARWPRLLGIKFYERFDTTNSHRPASPRRLDIAI